jgi:hypothetical protein
LGSSPISLVFPNHGGSGVPPDVGKDAGIPRQRRSDAIVEAPDRHPRTSEIVQVSEGGDASLGPTEVERSGLSRDRGPAAAGARFQRIVGRIIAIVDGDSAGARLNLERPVEKIRPEGRMMTPHHPHGLRAEHAHGLPDREEVAVNRQLAPHVDRHRTEPARQPNEAALGLRLPRDEGRLAVKAVKDAIEFAGIAAVRKQERPAAAIPPQPGLLVRRRVGVRGA